MKHFKVEEFACTHCDDVSMDQTFLNMIDIAREEAGVPFKITSGYRCPEHNKAVGGVSDSAHVGGYAADIACSSGSARYKIIAALLKVGFNRVGVSKNFIHVDCDPGKPSQVIWTY